ncbi:MAG: pre-peptidase C-terminal domain-containing protein, partial [Elainellaceae cyanobacterium]
MALPEADGQETSSGSVDADGNKWQTHDLAAPAAGTISVALDWENDSANLNLFVRRVDPADPSGPGELVTRSLSAAKPEQVSFDAQQGEEYRLIVGAESGASDYTLVTNQTDSPRREFLGTVDIASQVAREHDFTLTDDSRVAVSLAWVSDGEVDLYLRDDAGKVVTNSLLDSNPKLLTVDLPAGDYTWLVKAKSGAAAYTLISEERESGPIAEGDQFVFSGQAGYTRPNGSTKTTQTHDLTVAEAGEVTLRVTSLNDGGQPDIFARPINGDGSLGKAVTGSGADLMSQQASFQAETGTTYRVVVRANDGPTDYDVQASLDTTPLRQINGTVDEQSQVGRVYTLVVDEPGLVSADLSWAGDADLSLFVRSPEGRLAAFARTNANPERLTFEAPEAGNYRIQVSARSGNADYQLSTTLQTDVGRVYSGNVGFDPDPGTGARSGWTSHDYVAAETGVVTLQLTAESDADLGLYVREITDPDRPNSSVLLTSSRTSIAPERASFQVTQGSSYRLYVSTAEADGSPYS